MTTKPTAAEVRQRYVDGLTLCVPDHMHGGISRYMERGVEPGAFLYSLLRGELERAYLSADPVNKARRREWDFFLEHHLPAECHGTPEKCAEWIKLKGLSGWPSA